MVVPRVLPSGEPAGETMEGRSPRHYTWGTGTDQVVELVGELAFGDIADWRRARPNRLRVRGHPGALVPIGDDGVGQKAFMWQAGDCAYTVWVNAPHTGADVIRYAGDF